MHWYCTFVISVNNYGFMWNRYNDLHLFLKVKQYFSCILTIGNSGYIKKMINGYGPHSFALSNCNLSCDPCSILGAGWCSGHHCGRRQFRSRGPPPRDTSSPCWPIARGPHSSLRTYRNQVVHCTIKLLWRKWRRLNETLLCKRGSMEREIIERAIHTIFFHL